MKIGERIRSIRESKHMTQYELAHSIHVSPSFMNRLEQGSSIPSLEHITNIAQALHVTPQDVLCDIFVYPDESSNISEKIRITVEKFSPERQLLFLQMLEYLSSKLD